MGKSEFRQWIGNFTNNLAATIAYPVLSGGCIVLLARLGHGWTLPIVYGLITALLVLLIILAFRAIKMLPPAGERITNDNVEANVRLWLDRTNLTVKKDPVPQAYFRYIVTTDGGKKVILGRTFEGSGYLQFRAEISPDEDDEKALKEFDDGERSRLTLEIQLELARAVIGYSGLDLNSDGGFAIFKKIPITHSLNEDQVIRSIWEMEAVLISIFTVGGMAFQRHRNEQGKARDGGKETKLLRGETGPEAV